MANSGFSSKIRICSLAEKPKPLISNIRSCIFLMSSLYSSISDNSSSTSVSISRFTDLFSMHYLSLVRNLRVRPLRLFVRCQPGSANEDLEMVISTPELLGILPPEWSLPAMAGSAYPFSCRAIFSCLVPPPSITVDGEHLPTRPRRTYLCCRTLL